MSRHVAFVIPGDIDSRTGGYGYDRRLMAGLRALGWTVDHVALGSGFPAPTGEELADAEARLAALPDGAAVLIDGLACAVLPDAIRRHAGRLRIVALCHHPLALETGLAPERSAALAASEKAALAACRAVVVTSSPTAETLISDFAVPVASITIALPGTDPQPPAPADGEPPVLLTMATLTRRKGHDVLIDALSRIRMLPWTSRIVGGDHFDPDWTRALHALVDAHGLGDRITFTGAVDDPAPCYRQADIFVLPSRYEGYGMVFAEALAHGLPVVAARAGAVPAVVPPEAGILVPPDDAAALAAALASLIMDPETRAHYRAGARAAAARLPGWDRTARTVSDLLERITA